MLEYWGYPTNPHLNHSQIQEWNMEESHQNLQTLNEGGFYGDKEVEGYTLEWDWDDHTIHKKMV